jgi:phospholipid-binding lipoprotein MlaA
MAKAPSKHALFAIAAAMLAGCASVPSPTPGDPLESVNRSVFKFNDELDTYALKPVAKGYEFVVPQPVRSSVTNFFSNIGDVYVAANELVELKIADGVGDIMRVVINTVFGVGGLFDVATLAQLPKHSADFGITLGHYGVPPGPYLVLPLMGPSTVRDAGGLVVDYFGNPLSYVNPAAVSWSLYGVNLINTRANLLTTTDVLSGAAIDKYSFIRNAYLQRRQFLISGGNSESGLPNYNESLPKYDDSDDSTPAAAAPNGASGTATSAPAAPAAVGGPNSGAPTVPGQQYVPLPQRTTVPGFHLPH